MKNVSNELYSILANLNSQLVTTDVNTSLFKVLLRQLEDVITAIQYMDHAETLQNIMADTSSDDIRDAIKEHLKEIE